MSKEQDAMKGQMLGYALVTPAKAEPMEYDKLAKTHKIAQKLQECIGSGGSTVTVKAPE
jgi:hypothetical protein